MVQGPREENHRQRYTDHAPTWCINPPIVFLHEITVVEKFFLNKIRVIDVKNVISVMNQ